ncbi:YbaN family protein [Mycoplasma sp. P36-A1]|uniref:YbaN family protein n=1 Tax=Mycoplasma sp. P36-A1 TaxID=3252900 RepID=UPI003C2EE996
MKRFMIFSCGVICVVIGLVGIILHILPTTPFLLLASICFVKTSEKALNILYSNKLCKAYLQSYLEDEGVSASDKRKAFLFLSVGMCFSMVMVPKLWLQLMLCFIYICVTLHIYLIKNKSYEEVCIIDNVF